VELSILWNCEGRDGLDPINPEAFLRIIHDVKDVGRVIKLKFVGSWLKLLLSIDIKHFNNIIASQKLDDELMESLSTILLNGGTYCPNNREEYHVFNLVINIFGELGILFFIGLEHNFNKINCAEGHIHIADNHGEFAILLYISQTGIQEPEQSFFNKFNLFVEVLMDLSRICLNKGFPTKILCFEENHTTS